MTSKTLAQLMADLVITQSHSRPHVSDDNPFIESHFKTAKYRPDFPDRFMGARDGGEHFRRFFDWYNNEHHHSGIAYLTPADVHYGRAEDVIAARQQVLDATFAVHPERFVRRPPRAGRVPKAVWINPPNEPTPEVAEPQCPLSLAALRDRPVGALARPDAQRPALARGPTAGLEHSAVALGSEQRHPDPQMQPSLQLQVSLHDEHAAHPQEVLQ